MHVHDPGGARRCRLTSRRRRVAATRSTPRPAPTRSSSATEWPEYRDGRRRPRWRRRMARPLVLDANRFLGATLGATRASAIVAWGQPQRMSRVRCAGRIGASSPAPTRAWASRSPAPTSQAGASVLLCARDADAAGGGARRGRRARAARPGASLAVPGRRLESGRRRARSARDALDACSRSVHVLVNNAGVYGPMGPIEDVDWDGLGAGDRDQHLRLGPAVPRAAAALQAAALRQDRPALRRRRDQSAAADQRLRRLEGGHRALRRVAGARGARTTASTSTRSRLARSTRG